MEFVCIVGVSMCVGLTFSVPVPWGFVCLFGCWGLLVEGDTRQVVKFFFFACYCFAAGDNLLQAKGWLQDSPALTPTHASMHPSSVVSCRELGRE